MTMRVVDVSASPAKECQLCRRPAEAGGVCKPCSDRVNEGFHPIVCANCTIGGRIEHTTWVHATDLPKDTQTIALSLRERNDVVVYVQSDCYRCEKERN